MTRLHDTLDAAPVVDGRLKCAVLRQLNLLTRQKLVITCGLTWLLSWWHQWHLSSPPVHTFSSWNFSQPKETCTKDTPTTRWPLVMGHSNCQNQDVPLAPIICLHLSLSTSISLSKCIIISLSTISTSIAYISVLLPVYNVCIPHLILSWARRRTSKFCWYCWELSLSRALKPQWLGIGPSIGETKTTTCMQIQ